MKAVALFALMSILFTNLLSGPASFYKIEQESPGRLVISFQFPDPVISGASQNTPTLKLFQIEGLPLTHQLNRPVIPVLSLPLTLPDDQPAVSVAVGESEDYPDFSIPVFEDIGLSGETDSRVPPAKPFLNTFPQNIFEVSRLGLFRDFAVYALKVYPVQVLPGGVRFYKKFKITLNFKQPKALYSRGAPSAPSERELLKKMVINKNGALTALPQSSSRPEFSPPEVVDINSRVRLIVNKSGLYQITGQDLENAGIDISQINPNQFLLLRRGIQVPYYLVGGVDNTFNREDYIEFWGEPNIKTFQAQNPEMYVDPFSDENVYWLQWGGTPGLRMVEESGGIVNSQPGQFNPAPFYSQTVHVESNKVFERLGFGSVDKLSHERDLWFFDSGVKAVGKQQYPFKLEFPDSSSFNPVTVTAMFSGKSFQGPAHQVMVWLNNSLVGSSRPDWFGQDTSRITNRNNSSIRNFDLYNGSNTLEIQLPQSPVRGSDIVLLNWFEVTYDRKYKVADNYIEFGKPSLVYFPDNPLFQYELTGFTRPDIEIYKKGISKIVNFRIEGETVNNRVQYKVVFQDQVLSEEVEYIALTPDKKLKPVRIERDEPFDLSNPSRVLKDPSNSADYLIITHPRFYPRAAELADYRRSQGLDVEVVNVQDIYDEFNYGIKSPLAIRDFIRYVYFNWNQNRKLKYVTLFGDANFNYKRSNTGLSSDDFVPTFFYQTYKFGASATDYPYSLISGDDLLPDVFVGRIPVMTLSDASSVVDKIMEYEQNPVIGPWRNQALFISGNDAVTFEFENPNKPLFRSQNSRVLEVLLPKELSAFRLNTIRNPNLAFDPNFGRTTELIDYFDNGVSYINFMGHGGGAIWADVKLFNLQDVDRLNNKGMYPFITSMTCFTGAFDNPANMGLAQKLLAARDKGAIGILASSGLGWAYNDYAILFAVDQFLFDPGLTVGEAVALGKIQYISTGEYFIEDSITIARGFSTLGDEMIYQYNLIGDPYITLSVPENRLQISLSNTVPGPGETVQVTIDSPLPAGDGYIEIADKDNQVRDRLPLTTTTFRTQISFTVPEDFPDGTGEIRAYLSDGQADAHGAASIGVNFAVMDSLIISPSQPRATDSVNITLFLKDLEDIEQVYILVEGVQDTIFTQEISTGVYQTVNPIPPTNFIRSVFFTVYIKNSRGNLSAFRNLRYRIVDNRPDPFVFSGTMSFSGREKVEVKVGVGNNGNSPAEGIVLRLYEGYQNFVDQKFFAEATFDIQPRDSLGVSVEFPLSLSQAEFMIYAQLVTPGLESDFNPQNNLDSLKLFPSVFNVSSQMGSTYNNSSPDTLRNAYYSVYFPGGSVNENSAVRIRLNAFEAPATQKGLQPISLVKSGEFDGLLVKLLNPAVSVVTPYFLQLKLNPQYLPAGMDFQNLKLYHRRSENEPWAAIVSAVDTVRMTIQATTTLTGEFAPFLSNDRDAPTIELTVDGRPIKRRAQVSTNPTMYLIVEDASGIKVSRQSITMLLDEQAIPEDQVFIPDSVQQGDIVGITLYPELTNGSHRLTVRATDVNGNVSEKEFGLLVSDEFDLHIFGNYPNPFSDQTIFSYFVSPDVLDEFEIRIYTISGRLIRRLTEDINTINQPFGARSAGYNELIWDGTDDDGIEVANGVYFALVRAKYQDQVKEEILKVAKLK